MRFLAYTSAVICLLLLGLQGEIIRGVWFGPKENHIHLMAIPMLAPFVFFSAAATFAFANRIDDESPGEMGADGEKTSRWLSARNLQRFGLGVAIVQALMFLAG